MDSLNQLLIAGDLSLPLALALVCAMFAALALAYRRKQASGAWPALPQGLAWIAAIAYLLLMLGIYLKPGMVAQPAGLELADIAIPVNLQPFAMAADGALATHMLALASFVPLAPAVYTLSSSRRAALTLGLAIPLLIEPTQYLIDVATVSPSFVVDIDDAILYVAGSLIGVGIAHTIDRMRASAAPASQRTA